MDGFLKTGKLGAGGSSGLGSSSKDKQSSKELKKINVPWVEKYRPKKMDEVVYQEEVVSVLKKTLSGADLPNLLFYGPPGTGKTSTILACAREMFGDLYKERVMELNASDERGIQVIREKVKKFAQKSVSTSNSSKNSVPPYKIIILDEADSMTGAAQAALRRTMETQTKTTRFCLLCNYVSRIIDPLTSRCSKFRFKPLPEEVVIKHLTYICDEEKVIHEEGTLKSLVDVCEGDLRRAITTLQSVARLNKEKNITEQDIYDISGVLPNDRVQDLFEVCQSQSYDKLSDSIESIVLDGYSATQFINQVHDAVMCSDHFSNDKKAVILEAIAVCEHRLCDGADEYLQVLHLGCQIMQQFR